MPCCRRGWRRERGYGLGKLVFRKEEEEEEFKKKMCSYIRTENEKKMGLRRR